MWKKIRVILWSILLVGVGFFGNAVWQAAVDSTGSVLRTGLDIIGQPLASRFERWFFQIPNQVFESQQSSRPTNRLENRLQNQIRDQIQSVIAEGQQDYDNGSYVTAYEKWRPIAELGHAGVQDNVGVMYALGQGVAQDYQAAHIWFNIAGANGNEEARARRDYIQNRLPPTALIEAQRLANQCIGSAYKDCP